jgi:hypothetical protein
MNNDTPNTPEVKPDARAFTDALGIALYPHPHARDGVEAYWAEDLYGKVANVPPETMALRADVEKILRARQFESEHRHPRCEACHCEEGLNEGSESVFRLKQRVGAAELEAVEIIARQESLGAAERLIEAMHRRMNALHALDRGEIPF